MDYPDWGTSGGSSGLVKPSEVGGYADAPSKREMHERSCFGSTQLISNNHQCRFDVLVMTYKGYAEIGHW